MTPTKSTSKTEPERCFLPGTKTQPIEVWLSQQNLQVTCTVVYEDERTDHVDIDALSMRGAQREITGWLIGNGYTPAGRWEIEADGHEIGVDGFGETFRRFAPTKADGA